MPLIETKLPVKLPFTLPTVGPGSGGNNPQVDDYAATWDAINELYGAKPSTFLVLAAVSSDALGPNYTATASDTNGP